MPVKNTEKYIKQCVDSVLNQTHKNFEFIILDDSDDKTTEIIKGYSDSRIMHIRYKGNISSALNYGIGIASSEYICRMDGDDIMKYNRLETQIKFLNDNPHVDILGSNFYCIDENNVVMYEKKFPETHEEIEFMMPIITSVLHPTIMLKKKDYLRMLPYKDTVEDLELFLRVLNDFKFYNLQTSLYYYRLYRKKTNVLKEKISYNLGHEYLKDKIKSSNNEKLIYQLGLLEYYRNDVIKARNIFLKLLFSSAINKSRIIRYLLPSFLGNYLLKNLRGRGFLVKFNSLAIKYLKCDTYSIRNK